MTTLYPEVTRENVWEIGAALTAGLRNARLESARSALRAEDILNGRTPEQIVENFLVQIETDKKNGKSESHLNLWPSELVCWEDVSNWWWNYHMRADARERLSEDYINSLEPLYMRIYTAFTHLKLELAEDIITKQVLRDDVMQNDRKSNIILVITHQ